MQMTCQQVDALVRGDIDLASWARMRGRCVVVTPPNGGGFVAELVEASRGCVRVRHYRRRSLSARRGDTFTRGPTLSLVPLAWVRGAPFHLYNGAAPLSASPELETPSRGEQRLGSRTSRSFGDCEHTGVVSAVFPGDEVLYHVRYDDSDSKDLNADEVDESIERYRKRARAWGHAPLGCLFLWEMHASMFSIHKLENWTFITPWVEVILEVPFLATET